MSPIITEESAVYPESALQIFAEALHASAAELYGATEIADIAPIAFEAPRRPEFGDFATNAAFGLAKTARTSPQNVATALIARVLQHNPQLHEFFSQVQPAAGFINLRLAPTCWQYGLARILREAQQFGRASQTGQTISLEFGSANPTGPLVVVQGRTLSIGSTLANVLRFRGYTVLTEWIMNDYGAQMDALARSIYARYRQQKDQSFPFPEDGYPAPYVNDIAQQLRRRDGDRWEAAPESQWLSALATFGRDMIMAQQKEVAAKFGVQYDVWQSERELHEAGRVKEDLQYLTDKGLTYESDGATYFRASQFGDDKDRVILRSDGRPTYLAADIAYHYEKLKRADHVVDILGPDHHGYIGRIKGVAEALGYPGKLDVLISQQITLLRGDQLVSMSKRAGDIITLQEIIDEVGVDAARFFFIMLAPDSPLKFDLALAKEQSNNNPVYYVQYGHARISSVFKNAAPDEVTAARSGEHVASLEHRAELALVKRLCEFPTLLDSVTRTYAPHRLTHYARDVAADFHQFYTECRILVEEKETRLGRLALCIATKNVLATTLQLMGVSAPESM